MKISVQGFVYISIQILDQYKNVSPLTFPTRNRESEIEKSSKKLWNQENSFHVFWVFAFSILLSRIFNFLYISAVAI